MTCVRVVKGELRALSAGSSPHLRFLLPFEQRQWSAFLRRCLEEAVASGTQCASTVNAYKPTCQRPGADVSPGNLSCPGVSDVCVAARSIHPSARDPLRCGRRSHRCIMFVSTCFSPSFLVPSVTHINNNRTGAIGVFTPVYAMPHEATSSARIGGRLATMCATAKGGERSKEQVASEERPELRLSSLIRYPVKGGRAEPLTEELITAEGVLGDRRFMAARLDGTYLTQREHPQLATLETRVSSGTLHLRQGARSLNVTINTQGPTVGASLFGEPLRLIDQGPEVGVWLSSSGLLGSAAGGGVNPVSQIQQALFGAPPYRLLRAPDAPTSGGVALRRGAGLSDQAALLLICEESLAALNAKRARGGLYPVPMERFRPNLVLAGCGRAHAEDEWSFVKVGRSAEFRVVGPCPRCTVPDVGQGSGVRDMAGAGPMSTLRGYRARAGKGVLFGVYLAPLNPGERVRVGDAVEVR